MESDSDNQSEKFMAKVGSMLILLTFVFLINSCAPNNPEDIKALSGREDLPNLYFKELDIIATDSGRLKYRLITPEVLQFDSKEEPTIDFINGLHYYIYGANEEIESQIKCNFAIYFQRTEIWELRNDVEIVNVAGNVVNTELLFWDTKTKRIYSDEFVKITTNNDVLTGYGFETDEQISVYSIKEVSGDFKVEDTGEI
jgi:LPS export ABC transporter protein LptC